MIVIDTSALVAIALKEPEAAACVAAVEVDDEILVSAGTVVEALVVAARRNFFDDMVRLIETIGGSIMPVTPTTAHQAGAAYRQWGKGLHRAGLNFGDCFAYQVAKEYGCRLLYVGGDFSKTDIESVL